MTLLVNLGQHATPSGRSAKMVLFDLPLCLCSRGCSISGAGADGDGEDLTAIVDEDGKLLESSEPARRALKFPDKPLTRSPRRAATSNVESFAQSRGHFLTKLNLDRNSPDRPRHSTMAAALFSPKGNGTSMSTQSVSDGGFQGSLKLQSLYLQEHAKWASEAEEDYDNTDTSTGIWKGFGMLMRGVKTFRKIAANLGPDEVAKTRGVHVEKVFDFYDPAERKIVVKRMTDEVVHYRAALMEDGKALPCGRTSSKTSGASSPHSSNRQVPMLDEFPERELDGDVEEPHVVKKKSKRRSISEPNLEALSQWAVFTGHLLHRHVVDFKALSNKAVEDKHEQDFKLKPGGGINVLASVRERAYQVVSAVEKLTKRIAKEPVDRLDSEWIEDNLLEQFFGGASYLDTLMLLANAARKVLEAQPVCVDTQSPARVFGDTHGHLRDVLLLFRAYGMPHQQDGPVFVFNGDFVDRGSHQVELIGVLLAMKVLMPTRVWLVRGNHEDRSMNERYGFRSECYRLLGRSFGQRIFELLQKVFEQMPLACVIDKRVLCVHGGIGDGTWTMSDLRRVKRPLGEEELMKPMNVWLMNILWSDPIEDDQEGAEGVFGVHDSPRGSFASNFAWNVTKQFCARNGLSLVVRSHQSKRQSLGFDVMHDHLLMRVFSARDYEGHGNDSAVLLITPSVSDQGTILSIRPQVLRSVTKARQEQQERKSLAVEAAAAAAAAAGEDGRRKSGSRGKDALAKGQRCKTPPCPYSSEDGGSPSSRGSSGSSLGRSRTPPVLSSCSSSTSADSSPSKGRQEAVSASMAEEGDCRAAAKAHSQKDLRRNLSAPASGLRGKSGSRSKSGLKENAREKIRKKKYALQDSLASLVSK